jgi:short-subunit dehydrogenase
MKRKVLFITGATDGIGRIAATELAARLPEATILIHGRNPAKLGKTVSEIQKLSGNSNIESFLADFSSLDEVRLLSGEILSKHDSIDVLINNAGAGLPRRDLERMAWKPGFCKLPGPIFTHTSVASRSDKSCSFPNCECCFCGTIPN